MIADLALFGVEYAFPLVIQFSAHSKKRFSSFSEFSSNETSPFHFAKALTLDRYLLFVFDFKRLTRILSKAFFGVEFSKAEYFSNIMLRLYGKQDVKEGFED